MIIKLDAKSKHLEIELEICSKNPLTNAIFSESKYAMSKRLQGVALGIRSELLMFLIDVEKEMDLNK